MQQAVLLERAGGVLASTLGDETRSHEVAEAARAALEAGRARARDRRRRR